MAGPQTTEWGDAVVASPAAATTEWGDPVASSGKSEDKPGVLSRAATQVGDFFSTAAHVMNPENLMAQIPTSWEDLQNKWRAENQDAQDKGRAAVDQFKKGNIGTGISTLMGAEPFMGQSTAQAAEHLRKGDVGKAAGTLAPYFIPAAKEAAPAVAEIPGKLAELPQKVRDIPVARIGDAIKGGAQGAWAESAKPVMSTPKSVYVPLIRTTLDLPQYKVPNALASGVAASGLGYGLNKLYGIPHATGALGVAGLAAPPIKGFRQGFNEAWAASAPEAAAAPPPTPPTIAGLLPPAERVIAPEAPTGTPGTATDPSGVTPWEPPAAWSRPPRNAGLLTSPERVIAPEAPAGTPGGDTDPSGAVPWEPPAAWSRPGRNAGLLPPGPEIRPMPEATDTSGAYPWTPPEYWNQPKPGEAAAAAATPTPPPPDPFQTLLDDLASSQGDAKTFKSLQASNPGRAAKLEGLARNIFESEKKAPPATPAQPEPIITPPPESAPTAEAAPQETLRPHDGPSVFDTWTDKQGNEYDVNMISPDQLTAHAEKYGQSIAESEAELNKQGITIPDQKTLRNDLVYRARKMGVADDHLKQILQDSYRTRGVGDASSTTLLKAYGDLLKREGPFSFVEDKPFSDPHHENVLYNKTNKPQVLPMREALAPAPAPAPVEAQDLTSLLQQSLQNLQQPGPAD